MRARRRRDLPGLLRRRRLARVRRLRRAAAGRPLRGRRHEARAPLEAGLRAAALLLLRAGRADPGVACRSGCTSCSARTSGRACASPTSSPTTTACASGSSARSRRGSTSTRCRSRSATAATSSSAARARWRADDHLSLVARMRRDQIRRLEAEGIAHGRGARARAGDDARPPTMAPRTFETLRDQAAMQVAARTDGHTWKVLAAGAGARVRAAAAAERRRPLLRHRGRPVLGARPRARVPLGDRRHRGRVPAVLGARPRAGAAGRRGRDRPDPRAPRRRPARCTSTTTPPTRSPR